MVHNRNCAILLDEILKLKPIIFANNHIPKDTFDVLKRLEECKPHIESSNTENIYLATFDVTALYTAINQTKATERVTKIINTTTTQIPAEIYTTMTQYILQNNYFSFQNTIDRQNHGITMGNPAGGAIVNTFMIEWDQSIFNNHMDRTRHPIPPLLR